jgi:hypothetical protein
MMLNPASAHSLAKGHQIGPPDGAELRAGKDVCTMQGAVLALLVAPLGTYIGANPDAGERTSRALKAASSKRLAMDRNGNL